ncbi:uncharacterized protein TNCV_3650791 [Trichonephila clavipes]|uniref:Uncharacterized protein n=1 Tax=Trichonephila clavipes TaxID=2585209 RepID=A0A8X6SE47_TRICX|nr:uncharacterized protein TNCV_3650791 [Trichonephila clavipes]
MALDYSEILETFTNNVLQCLVVIFIVVAVLYLVTRIIVLSMYEGGLHYVQLEKNAVAMQTIHNPFSFEVKDEQASYSEFSSFVGAHFKFHFVVGHQVESMAALVSEYTLEFFTLLNARGKKELIEWCMKEGLIASSYECPKCNEQMGLNERKSVVLDGFEWRCRKKGVNTLDESPHPWRQKEKSAEPEQDGAKQSRQRRKDELKIAAEELNLIVPGEKIADLKSLIVNSDVYKKDKELVQSAIDYALAEIKNKRLNSETKLEFE